MYEDGTIHLAREGTRHSNLLPFHLVWYGRLSKKQGEIAKAKGLIVVKNSEDHRLLGQTAYLTKKGRRGADFLLGSDDFSMARIYAHLLEHWGYVTNECFYVYPHAPLADNWSKLRK